MAPTPSKPPTLILSPAGGVPGYIVEFQAEVKMQINGYLCTGSAPTPCASKQPCSVPVDQIGVIQLPVQLSGAPTGSGSPGAFTIAPTGMEGTPGSPCYEFLQIADTTQLANGPFPPVPVTADCSKIQTCQAVQKTVDDTIDFSASHGPDDQEKYDMKLRICFNDDPDCPTLKIADQNGNVLSDSDTPQTDKVVGQLIQLNPVTDPKGQTIDNLNWTLPDNPIAIQDYEMTAANATITPIPATALTDTKNPLKFYWTVGGNQTVRLSGQVKTSDGKLWGSEAELDYTVDRPQLSDPSGNLPFTVVSGTTEIVTDFDPEFIAQFKVTPGSVGLFDGPVSSGGGSKFHAAVQAAPEAGGKIGFAQLITSDQCSRVQVGNAKRISHPGQSGFDAALGGAAPPYFVQDISAAANGNDRPGNVLDGSNVATTSLFSASRSFDLYLMYQPTGTKSIWVTLGVASWKWSGTASQRGGEWTAKEPLTFKDVLGADSTALPVWNNPAQVCSVD